MHTAFCLEKSCSTAQRLSNERLKSSTSEQLVSVEPCRNACTSERLIIIDVSRPQRNYSLPRFSINQQAQMGSLAARARCRAEAWWAGSHPLRFFSALLIVVVLGFLVSHQGGAKLPWPNHVGPTPAVAQLRSLSKGEKDAGQFPFATDGTLRLMITIGSGYPERRMTLRRTWLQQPAPSRTAVHHVFLVSWPDESRHDAEAQDVRAALRKENATYVGGPPISLLPRPI